MSLPVNHFTHRTAAERYAAGRPYVHPFIVEHIRQQTGVDRCRRALDVGCGTGQSTRALTAIAEQVVGIDQSADMLAVAEALPNIEYHVADAESLPFPDGSFDLVTAGLAFHWFNQERFLNEARRVLRGDGWIALYNFVFLGEMETNPSFREWFRAEYVARYPSPPRHKSALAEEFVGSCGLQLAGHEIVRHTMPMSRGEFVSFLLTQSNVIAAVENGSKAIEDVETGLDAGAEPYFTTGKPLLVFEFGIHYLRPLHPG